MKLFRHRLTIPLANILREHVRLDLGIYPRINIILMNRLLATDVMRIVKRGGAVKIIDCRLAEQQFYQLWRGGEWFQAFIGMAVHLLTAHDPMSKEKYQEALARGVVGAMGGVVSD